MNRQSWPVPFLQTLALGFAFFSCTGKADQVYSGPQPGEKTTPFTSIELRGPGAGQERNIVAEHQGAPTTLVFVHGIERSMAPLMSVIDQYGHEQKERLKTEFVFLSSDRLTSQQRLPAMGQSLRMQTPMSLSADGLEGPGNYGLNKECLMTVVVAKDNKVTANFALVQPGVADAKKILAAMARTIGDENPPDVEALRERRGIGGGRMQAGQAMERRRDLANAPKGELPGAAPTDEKLIGLLRRFIQKSNEDSTVDRILAETEKYVRESDDLTKQAIDGWTRVLHLNYGTEYAQRTGLTWIEKLQKPAK